MKILVPVDFSDNSKNALTFACQLALEKNASIALLYVFAAPLVNEATASGEMVSRMITDQNEFSAKRLSQFTQELVQHNPDFSKLYFSYRVILGFAADIIIEYAIDNEMDMIVMGLRGETNAIDRAIGSVAGKVMNRAKCPVIGVPDQVTYQSIRNVGYATDYNSNDAGLVLKTKSLFGEMVNYEVFHVNTHEFNVENTDGDSISDENMRYLKKELTDLGLENVKIHIENYPNLVGGIQRIIEKDNVDLIVMLHEKKAWLNFFKGSDTKDVAFSINKPLLIYHE